MRRRKYGVSAERASRRPVCLFLCLGSLRILDAAAGPLDAVVVTVTRVAEPADGIPADISVVSAGELRARDATDLAAAASLVPGVEAPPGGDAGPSSAVPSFWGLHEFDAFLLVVDGIPWGGAFNPGMTTLDFADVERVEIMKGAAPVMYGATSFVGVVQAVHYPAGEAADEADFAFGSYGSVRGSASMALPSVGDYRESFAVSGKRSRFADARELASDGQLLYRGELDTASGKLRLDADLFMVHDVPASPVIRVGSALNTRTPIDANFNPADARIDKNKYHVAIGYTRSVGGCSWESLISYAYDDIKDIRAFLEPDLSGLADTQNQRRHIDDGYADTHLSHSFSPGVSMIAGSDILYGRGRQGTLNGTGAYAAPLNGSLVPPATTSLPVSEIGRIDDRRVFAGQYGQIDWKPGERWNLLAGIRVNEIYEDKFSSDLILATLAAASERTRNTIVRPSQTVGFSYRLWVSGGDQGVVYADFRNAYKPAAIDFGPDYSPQLLRPESAQSYEAGLKGTASEGRLGFHAAAFVMNFNNLVVATASGALANAAQEKLQGAELEVRYRLAADVEAAATASYHDSRFEKYVFFAGDAGVDVSGRQLPLSPHLLASAGVLYTPASGWGATGIARYVGRRFLDEENTASVPGYVLLDATLEYRIDRYRFTLEGSDLTGRRPPVSASEFGSESFYLLPARMLWVRVGYNWR